jgi:hypothetical protein
VTWQEKLMYIYSYVRKEDEPEELIFELAKNLLDKKDIGPAIICFIMSCAVDQELELGNFKA